MRVERHPPVGWRSIRIPLRLVERVYGRDMVDVAGDDILHALRQVSDYPDQHKYRFEIDASHTNPWYHALVFNVENMSDTKYAIFTDLLAMRGLSEKD